MEGYIGEIRGFAGNFAPRTWALCEGQLLAISSHTALFSIIGTIYGGDGRTTFALPDLRGRTMIGPGTGPGLPSYREGQRTGAPTTALSVLNLPPHNHAAAVTNGATITQVQTASDTGDVDDPSGAILAIGEDAAGANVKMYRAASDADGHLANSPGALQSTAVTVGLTGGGQAFNNMQPSLGVYYIICLQGIFPSRS